MITLGGLYNYSYLFKCYNYIDFNFSFSKCCIVWCGGLGFGFCASFLLLFVTFVTKASIAANLTFYIIFCTILTLFGGITCTIIRKCRDKTFGSTKGMTDEWEPPIAAEMENPLMEFDLYNFYSVLGVDTKGK